MNSKRHGILWAVSLAWVIPLWVIDYLPMVDYPQQLAAASILRFYQDPARNLQQAYELALLRPHGLFELITAGLAWILPIESAGKVVLSLCLAGVVPAAVALCRRAGRPDWYALFALAVTYGHAFYWGFTDNLLAYPLVLAGGALADRLFDRPRFGLREWLLLAGAVLLFYAVHLQFLLVFVGLVGWLALARRPRPRQLALWLSALLPGLLLGGGVLSWLHLHSSELMTGYQERLQSIPPTFLPVVEKAANLPQSLFGAYAAGAQYLMAALLLVAILVLAVPFARTGPERSWRDDLLYRSRFLVPALGLLIVFFTLPEFAGGYLVSERLLPMAFMLLVPALPLPPAGSPRRRIAVLLLAGLLTLQLGQTFLGFLGFSAESAGLRELIEETKPGQPVAGMMFRTSALDWTSPRVLIHFPAYYQVARGGRMHFSFVQFFNSPVRYRPGRNWEDGVLAEWDEWNPHRFSYPRHGRHFRYFLVRGGPEDLVSAFGPYLAGLRVRSAGGWYLVERPPG